MQHFHWVEEKRFQSRDLVIILRATAILLMLPTVMQGGEKDVYDRNIGNPWAGYEVGTQVKWEIHQKGILHGNPIDSTVEETATLETIRVKTPRQLASGTEKPKCERRRDGEGGSIEGYKGVDWSRRRGVRERGD